MKRVCVFCGSSAGDRPCFADAARQVGERLAMRGYDLVYGGGRVGLMGAVADAVLDRGGRVYGVIPEQLAVKELKHDGLTELRIVRSMHERKQAMADLADGFIALPGGFGTLDEFFEILTWGQLGVHTKPIGLLNVEGFFGTLLEFVQQLVDQQFVKEKYREILLDDVDIDRLLDRMSEYRSPRLEQWLDRQGT